MYLTIVVSRGVLWLRTNSVSFSAECVLKNTSIFSTNDGLIEGQQTSIFLTSEKPSRDFAWMTLKHKKSHTFLLIVGKRPCQQSIKTMSELLIIQFPFIVIEVIKTPKKSNLSRKLLIWLLGLSRLNYKSYSLFSRQFKKKMVWGEKNPIGNEILCCVGVKLTHIHITCTAPLALRIFTSTSLFSPVRAFCSLWLIQEFLVGFLISWRSESCTAPS